MHTLRLACLGPVLITHGEHTVGGWMSSKALALLCYLAITGQPHSRAALAGLLWGELPEAGARANLRNALANVRQLVGDHVVATRDTIAFDRTAPFWLDIELVEQAAQASATMFDAQQLREAVPLIRGELLEGLFVPNAPDWDEWLTGQRERLHQLALFLLNHVATRALKDGAYVDGIDAATRLLALEPWQEDGHRLVMRLLALDGRRDGALAQYERCRELLERELGAEPALETTILADQIRSGVLKPAAPIRPRHNLPAVRQPLIGRADDVAAVEALLARDDVGVVTLIGPGGVGKTRLALDVAHAVLGRFSDGVWLVDLAPITSAELVLPTVVQVLGLAPDAQQTPLDSLQTALRDTAMLLVLDNLEQVLAAMPLLGQLIAVAPKLNVLATSRVRLPLYESHSYPVAPLALPPLQEHEAGGAGEPTLAAVHALSRNASVELFVRRAQAIVPEFTLTTANAAAVAAICIRLDGLPLAIELAAARIALYSPQALNTRLEDRLAVLRGGPDDRPERQRTLRATLAWSYNLLAPAAQTLFRRLAVFVGSCSLAMVETIVPDTAATPDSVRRDDVAELLGVLVAGSLVQRLPDAGDASTAEPRFGMLETIRVYALEHLETSGEAATVRQRHLEAFCALAEAAELETHGRAQAAVLHQLEREHDNYRAALHWADQAGQRELMLRLGSALGQFWLTPALQREGRHWLEHGLDGLDETHAISAAVRMRAQLQAGNLAAIQIDFAAANAHYAVSLALVRALGDRRALARVLYEVGAAASVQADHARATPALTESLALARELGDPLLIMHAAGRLGFAAAFAGRHAEAVALLEESLALVERAADEQFRCRLLLALGLVAIRRGELARAERHTSEAVVRLQAIGEPLFVGYGFLFWATIAAQRGQAGRGARMLGVMDAMVAVHYGTLIAALGEVYATTRRSLEEQLGGDVFMQGWNEGKALTWEQALAEGLDTA